MDNILCIESSCQNISFAIKHDNQIYTSLIPKNLQSENEIIYSNLDKLFYESKVKKSEIKAVAISNGPGSYTGLRIASSISKALCFSLKIPLIPINSLEILAQIGKIESPKSNCYLSLIDAGRQEVYANKYDNNLKAFNETKNYIISENEFYELLEKNKDIFMLGNGSLKTSLIHSYHFSSTEIEAKYMLDIASAKYLKNEFEEYTYHEPFYFKGANVGGKKI